MLTHTTPKPPATSADASSDNIPDKKSEKKIDLFHPEMPKIPGVSVPGVGSSKRFPAGLLGTNIQQVGRIGGMVAATLVVAVAGLWWIESARRAPAVSATAKSSVAEATVPDVPPLPPVEPVQEGPTVAATVDELSKPWTSKKFTFVNSLTRDQVDAVVIRLPGGGLWAFALREPYGHCDLEFGTDLGEIQRQYRFRASHPMVVNPCDGTVYDPLKVGPLGTSTWARGEVVQGSGLRPPISIDVQVRGRSIIADSIE